MRSQRRQIFSEINITPLTDIFLVLLIIMMVIAPMLDTQGLKLAVPTVGPSAAVTADPKVMTVRVSGQGRYTIENAPVSASDLQRQLFQRKAQYPEGLLIETEADATHGAVVKVMDAARSAGIEKIAVSQANA